MCEWIYHLLPISWSCFFSKLIHISYSIDSLWLFRYLVDFSENVSGSNGFPFGADWANLWRTIQEEGLFVLRGRCAARRRGNWRRKQIRFARMLHLKIQKLIPNHFREYKYIYFFNFDNKVLIMMWYKIYASKSQTNISNEVKRN